MTFHTTQDEQSLGTMHVNEAMALTAEFTYDFSNFFHPFVGELIAKLNKDSLPGLLDPVYQKDLTDEKFFNKFYTVLPGGTSFKIKHYPKKRSISAVAAPTRTTIGSCYSIFHSLSAVHLSKNQRFAEAQRWFHYIFDPTCARTSKLLEVPPFPSDCRSNVD